MATDRPYRLIISGGGTGGHIFPAIAIADEFMRRYPDARIEFVGAQGKMEMTRVPKAGYNITGLWISGLQRKLTMQNLLFPVKLLSSYFKARNIIKSVKPHAVVGTGGYASGPIMIAATRAGIPAVIQEQNSYAGLANKNVAPKASKICVAYDGMEKYFPKDKIVFTGNPVRNDIKQKLPSKEQALKHFNLKNDQPVILILGGSLGARTINDSIVLGLDTLLKNNMQVIWQTGRLYYEEMLAKSSQYDKKRLHVTEFIDDMKMAYAAADIIISRAGALSISEHCIVQKPVIYVPSPNVAEDHQRKNALALTSKEAAMMVEDKDARQQLAKAAVDLINNNDKQEMLTQNIGKLAKPNATEEIVNEIEKLIK